MNLQNKVAVITGSSCGIGEGVRVIRQRRGRWWSIRTPNRAGGEAVAGASARPRHGPAVQGVLSNEADVLNLFSKTEKFARWTPGQHAGQVFRQPSPSSRENWERPSTTTDVGGVLCARSPQSDVARAAFDHQHRLGARLEHTGRRGFMAIGGQGRVINFTRPWLSSWRLGSWSTPWRRASSTPGTLNASARSRTTPSSTPL